MELAEVLQIAEDLVDDVVSLNLCGTQAIDGWVTVGSACLYNRQAPGGDPLVKEFNNYYAVLETIDIADEFQNVIHEAVRWRAVDQRSVHKDNSRARAMKHRKKRTRKRRRKPTMRGVQFTNSPPIVPRNHIAPEFPSNGKYMNIKKYINVYQCSDASRTASHDGASHADTMDSIHASALCRLGVFVLTNADGDITNQSRISASCRFNHRIRGTERTVQRHDHS